MKIHFYKAEHFWEDGETATWRSSQKLDEKLLSELKLKYGFLSKTKPLYLIIDGKTVFLFYRGKKDFVGRPIVEITALCSKYLFKNPEQVYGILQSTNSVFNDDLELRIDIDRTLVKLPKHLIWYILIFLLVAFLLYIFRSEENKKENIEKNNLNVKHSMSQVIVQPEIINTMASKPLTIERTVPAKWKWEDFCRKNIVYTPRKCYEYFIVKKCKQKDKFKQNYFDFIKHNTNLGSCVVLEGLESLKEDKDIPKNVLRNYGIFFKE